MSSFEQIEQQKADLLAVISRWTAERLHFRLGEGEWSAVDVFDHLARTESAIQDAACHGLSNPQRIGIADRVRTHFLSTVFRSERKVKVPASANQVLPEVGSSISVVQGRWDASRKELADLLRIIPRAHRGNGIFRHPVGGWMSIEGILGFFSVHMIHHQYQLRRISEAYSSRFPDR